MRSVGGLDGGLMFVVFTSCLKGCTLQSSTRATTSPSTSVEGTEDH